MPQSEDNLVFLDRELLPGESVEGSLVVPLNQVAMREVLSRGLSYEKIEDYIDYEFSRRKKEDICEAFDRLFAAADKAAAELLHRPELAILGPFNLFAMYLRLNVEADIICYLLLQGIVRRHRPAKLALYSRPWAPLDELVASRRLAMHYRYLLAELAARERVEFVAQIAPAERKPAASPRALLAGKLKSIAYRYGKSRRWVQNRKLIKRREVLRDRLKGKALFLQTGWGVFYYSQYFDEVVVDTSPIERILNSAPAETEGTGLPCEQLFHRLAGATQTLSSLVGADVEFIVNHQLTAFLPLVPKIISQADAVSKYLETTKPDFVFYTNLSEQMLPVQLALARRPEITRVIKTHGDSIFDSTLWRKNELEPADLYLTEFPELAQYFRDNARKGGYATICESDGIRINAAKAGAKRKGTLVYVPWFFSPALSFDLVGYPSALFFRIQLRILEELNRQQRYAVVYKCFPVLRYDFHFPMPDYIRENFPQIRISHKSLKTELENAECCLLDSPSSAMWEAMDMRVPCHSLVWSRFHVRDTAVDCYRKYLTFFDSDLDVAEKVHSVLQEQKFFTITEQEAAPLKRTPSEVFRILQDSRNGRNGRAQCQ